MGQLVRRWWRTAALVGGLGAIALGVVFLGIPDMDRLRSFSSDLGPWFVVLFFCAHAAICTAPVPRTFFTLASGVLFGPVLGLGVALAATMVAAVAAFGLVRSVGAEFVATRLTHPAVRAVDLRLRNRGWLAIGSLRMIAVVPFSVLNYCAGLSSVRLVPYSAATLIGVLPGTASVVMVGSVLSGGANPIGLVVSVVGFALGITGMVVDTILPTHDTDGDGAPVSPPDETADGGSESTSAPSTSASSSTGSVRESANAAVKP